MQILKYSKYLQETSKNYKYIKFSQLDRLEKNKKIEYTFSEALTLLQPYVKTRFNEQFKIVIPIALYLLFFQMIVMKQSVEGGFSLAMGVACVILGLMFFMEGLKLGLMPFGGTIGHFLPIKAKKVVVLAIAFALGVCATFAEPAMGVLKQAGRIVDPVRAPLLYAMLNQYSGYTVMAVSIGVGAATLIAILMFIKSWSLKRLIFISLIPTLALTIYSFMDKNLSQVIGLAWDCGAVTTGPVTLPLVLSLGIGVSTVIKRKHTNNIPGFGLVTLASLYPILAVLSLAVILKGKILMETVPVVSGLRIAEQVPLESSFWWEGPIFQSIVLALRAIAPLILFLYIVQKYILKERIHHFLKIAYGIALCFMGMSLFNLGLSFGLTPLGNQVGSALPASYSVIESIPNSPLYEKSVGLALSFIFAFFMGYGATLAEPALNALGETVESLTSGAFRKKIVMIAVSLGVALGTGFGALKIIFDIQLVYFILPLYLLALLLTFISEAKYVNIGWDSAGVTTGPITVPLVLAMGLGFASATNSIDGFGILALASVFPIISVLCFGLCIHYLQKKVAPR